MLLHIFFHNLLFSLSIHSFILDKAKLCVCIYDYACEILRKGRSFAVYLLCSLFCPRFHVDALKLPQVFFVLFSYLGILRILFSVKV